jgi:hypothetical protein
MKEKGVFIMPHNKRFTTTEIDFIKTNYQKMSVDEIAKHLNRTPKATRTKIERLGLNLSTLDRNNLYPWDDSDVKILIDNYLLPDYKIQELLPNYSIPSIAAKRLKLNLRKHLYEPYVNGGYYEFYKDGKKHWVHKLNVEKSIGRKLLNTEKVHHIDGDKLNNNIENLYLCSDNRTHGLVHSSLESVAFELYKKGSIGFDKSTGSYYIK